MIITIIVSNDCLTNYNKKFYTANIEHADLEASIGRYARFFLVFNFNYTRI